MNQQPDAAENRCAAANQHESSAAQPNAQPSASGTKPTTPEAPRKYRDSCGKEKHWVDYATAGFAFLAALGGIAAAIFTAWQAWTANHQLAVAKDTEIRQLRAYVSVFPGKVSPINVQSDPVEFTATPIIKFFGQTPARRLLQFGPPRTAVLDALLP